MGKLEKIKLKAAGIDIGSERIFVAIEEQEVKKLQDLYIHTSPSSGVFTASWD